MKVSDKSIHLKNGNVEGGGVQQLLLQLEVERLAVLRAGAASHHAALLHLRSLQFLSLLVHV